MGICNKLAWPATTLFITSINWDLAWLYRYTNGNLTLTPGIGVEWNSDNQNEYYYGVSQHESRRSGMRSYDPDSSWNPYLELSANYRFLGDWSVYGIARYTRLSDEITDSPMVDKSWSGLISTGITYTLSLIHISLQRIGMGDLP